MGDRPGADLPRDRAPGRSRLEVGTSLEAPYVRARSASGMSGAHASRPDTPERVGNDLVQPVSAGRTREAGAFPVKVQMPRQTRRAHRPHVAGCRVEGSRPEARTASLTPTDGAEMSADEPEQGDAAGRARPCRSGSERPWSSPSASIRRGRPRVGALGSPRWAHGTHRGDPSAPMVRGPDVAGVGRSRSGCSRDPTMRPRTSSRRSRAASPNRASSSRR